MLYMGCSNAQLIFTRVHFVDLLRYPLGCSLDSLSDDGITLLGVAGVLATEDLEFPTLLDKSVGEDSIVVERGPGDGREHACDLRRG